MQDMRKGLRVRVAKQATQKVDDIYPVIMTGKPHHLTRKKQRIAWQLGYIKGFEEARALRLHQHIGEDDDR